MNSRNRERAAWRYRKMKDKRLVFIAGQRLTSLMAAVVRLDATLNAHDFRRDIRRHMIGQAGNHQDRGRYLMEQLDDIVRQLLNHIGETDQPRPKQ